MPVFIDIVLILVLVFAVAGASIYLIKAKKSGKTCIGCSSSGCGCSGEKTCHCKDKSETTK